MDKLRDLHALQPLGDASQRGLFLGRLYLCFWALLGCLSFVCCEADEPRLPRAKLSLTVYLEPVDEAWLNSAQPILSFSPQRGREAIFPLEKLPISEGRIQLTLERPWDGSLTVQLSTLQAELTEVAVEPRTSRLRRTRSLVFEAHSLRSYRYRAYEDAPPSVMVLNPLSFLQSQGQGPASERWDERMLFGDTLWWPLEGQPWTKAYTALFEAWQLMAKSWTGDSSQPLGATASWELLDHVEHLIDRQDENGLNALEINLGAALREALHHMPLTVESAQLLLRLPCSFTSLGHEQDSRELWTCPSIKALPPYLAYLSPVEGLSSASQRPTDIEILVYGLSGASVSSVGGDWILKSERHPLIVREAEPPTAFEPMTFSPKLGFEIPLHRAQFSLSWAEVNRPTVAVLVSAKDENDQREELGLNLPFISPPSTDLMGVISLLKPLPRQVITAMPLSSLWRSDDVMWTTESDEDGRFTLSIAGYKGALYLNAQRDDGRVSMIVNLPSFTLQEPSLIGVWLSPLSTLISWVTFTQADSQNDWTHALQTALWLRGVADFIMEEKSEINLGHWEDEEARLTRGRTYQNHLLETIARRSPCQAYALEAADQPEDQLYRPWTLFDLDPADISHHPEEALKRWGIWLIEGCFLHSVEGEESLSLAPLITAGILARDTASSDDSLSSQLTPALSVSRDSGSWAKEQGKSRWWFNGSELRITLSFWLGWTELALFQRSGLESVEVNIRPPLASPSSCLWSSFSAFTEGQPLFNGRGAWRGGVWSSLSPEEASLNLGASSTQNDDLNDLISAWRWSLPDDSELLAFPLPCEGRFDLTFPPREGSFSLELRGQHWGRVHTDPDRLTTLRALPSEWILDLSSPTLHPDLTRSDPLFMSPLLSTDHQVDSLSFFTTAVFDSEQTLTLAWRSEEPVMCYLASSADEATRSVELWEEARELSLFPLLRSPQQYLLSSRQRLTSSGSELITESRQRSQGRAERSSIFSGRERWSIELSPPQEGTSVLYLLCHDPLFRGTVYPLSLTLDRTEPHIEAITLRLVDQTLLNAEDTASMIGGDLSEITQELDLLQPSNQPLRLTRRFTHWARCSEACPSEAEDIDLHMWVSDEIWRADSLVTTLTGEVSIGEPNQDPSRTAFIEETQPVGIDGHVSFSLAHLMDRALSNLPVWVDQEVTLEATLSVTDPMGNTRTRSFSVHFYITPPLISVEYIAPELHFPMLLEEGDWAEVVRGQLGQLRLYNPHSVPLHFQLLRPQLSLSASRTIYTEGIPVSPDDVRESCLYSFGVLPNSFSVLFNPVYGASGFTGTHCGPLTSLPPTELRISRIDDSWLVDPHHLMTGITISPEEILLVDLPKMIPQGNSTLYTLMTPPHLPPSANHPSSAQHAHIEGFHIFTLRESCCAECEIEYLYGREVISLDALSFTESAPDEIELRRAGLPEQHQHHLGTGAWFLKFVGSRSPWWTSTYVPLPLTVEGEYNALND